MCGGTLVAEPRRVAVTVTGEAESRALISRDMCVPVSLLVKTELQGRRSSASGNTTGKERSCTFWKELAVLSRIGTGGNEWEVSGLLSTEPGREKAPSS